MPAARLLVVEDEAKLAANLKRGLGEAGFAVEVAPSAEAARASLLQNRYDLMLLDLRLPGQDGLEFLAALRAAGAALPVLILTARDSTDERVRGLDGGGDDYLTKPFATVELIARIEALLRRPAESRDTVLQVGPLELDLIERTARRGDRTIDLLPREFRLLEYMMRRKGQMLTRAMLLEEVWNYKFVPQTNLVDVHMGRLRRKVDEPPEPPMIHNVRGVGFILRAPS
jgi:two-component system OmpR family response regulator